MLLLLLGVACMDYGFDKLGEGSGPRAVDSAWQALDSAAPADTGWGSGAADPRLDCDAALEAAWSWSASAPFTAADDPRDGQGRAFHDADFDGAGFQALALPDQDIPVHHDRAYLGRVVFDTLPANLSLELQSDDGLWVWVNGQPAGHWGGAWQEEGCVNEAARCLHTVSVDALDVTALLVPGENLIAARVSNPVANAWFEIIPRCFEE